MAELERFDPEFDSELPNGQNILMEPYFEGEWVRYTDASAALEEANRRAANWKRRAESADRGHERLRRETPPNPGALEALAHRLYSRHVMESKQSWELGGQPQ